MRTRSVRVLIAIAVAVCTQGCVWIDGFETFDDFAQHLEEAVRRFGPDAESVEIESPYRGNSGQAAAAWVLMFVGRDGLDSTAVAGHGIDIAVIEDLRKAAAAFEGHSLVMGALNGTVAVRRLSSLQVPRTMVVAHVGEAILFVQVRRGANGPEIREFRVQ